MWTPIERDAAARILADLGYPERTLALLERTAGDELDYSGYTHGQLDGHNDRRWRLSVDTAGQWFFRYLD